MKSDITWSYDEDADVLYISLGEPAPSITEEVADGILVRHDMKTNKLSG